MEMEMEMEIEMEIEIEMEMEMQMQMQMQMEMEMEMEKRMGMEIKMRELGMGVVPAMESSECPRCLMLHILQFFQLSFAGKFAASRGHVFSLYLLTLGLIL